MDGLRVQLCWTLKAGGMKGYRNNLASLDIFVRARDTNTDLKKQGRIA